MAIDRWLRQVEVALGCVCLFGMFLVLLLNVLLRYLFGTSIFWAEELAGALFVWMGFLASAWCCAEDGHVRVTLLVDRLPRGARAALDTVVEVALVVVLVLIVAHSGEGLSTLQLTVAMRVPEQILYAIVPVTLAVSVLHVIVRIVRRLRGLPPPPGMAGSAVSAE